MNTFFTIESYYIRADKSIDVVLISNINYNVIHQNVIYIYNDQGVYFSVYDNFTDILNRIDGEGKNYIAEFEFEDELVYYLRRKYIVKKYD